VSFFIGGGDDANSPAVGEVGDGPLEHHEQPIAKTDEKEDVDAQPQQPGEQTGEAEHLQIGDGEGAADDGKVALIRVAKRRGRRQILHSTLDNPGDILALLDRGCCQPREWPRLPLLDAKEVADRRDDRSGVADNEQLRVAGNREIRAHLHPPRPIHFGAEPPAGRGATILSDLGHGRVGYDDLYLASGDFRRLTENAASIEWVPVVDVVRQLRAIKEPIEIEYLRRAIAITDDAYMSMREWTPPGTTEGEAPRHIERYVKDHGAEELAFSVLVGSGPNSAEIHHHPTDRPIQPGDSCWVDFGAKVEGYCADLSRAFCLGAADDRLLALYDAILAAQRENIAALVIGSDGAEIDRRTKAVLEPRGYTVGHCGGHGIGLQVHELPWLDRGLPIPVEENIVVCADPGVYITGWGGMRIEENVFVTRDGPEVLTRSSQELIIPV